MHIPIITLVVCSSQKYYPQSIHLTTSLSYVFVQEILSINK